MIALCVWLRKQHGKHAGKSIKVDDITNQDPGRLWPFICH